LSVFLLLVEMGTTDHFIYIYIYIKHLLESEAKWTMNVLHASSSISSSFRHIDICVHALHGPGHAYICTHDDRMELLSADAVEPRGAPDGAADRWRVRAAAVGAGDGGGAEPGPGRAVPVALRHRGLRRAQLPLQRGQLHGPDGRRHEQALHTRGLRPTGTPWHVALYFFSITPLLLS
jgi:hypothetical protein